MKSLSLSIQYFAILKEQRGESQEELTTSSLTAAQLYSQLKSQYNFSLSTDVVRVSINNEFRPWDTALQSGDQIVFIPPVAGG